MRLCSVNNRIAIFHRWNQQNQAIIEYEDGEVATVNVTNIKFEGSRKLRTAKQ